MLEYIFRAIVITSFIGAAATVLFIITKPITKKYFSNSWHYYMWLAVLIVMIFPLQISLPEYMQYETGAETVAETDSKNNANNITAPMQTVEKDFKLNSERESIVYGKLEELKTFAFDKTEAAAIVWIAVMIALFICKSTGYALFLSKLRRFSKIVSCPELLKFTKRKITTRVSNKIASPLMIGLFKPTLLLPETEMTEEQLNNVLAHEMTHFKRKDILYKWFVSIVKCVHWFNPFIYYINKQINIECEISCDLAVVKKMTEEQKSNYINTIITLLSAANRKKTALTTAMASDKKILQMRFAVIRKRKRVKKSAKVISIILAAVLSAGTLLGSGVLAATVFKENSSTEHNFGGKTTEFENMLLCDNNIIYLSLRRLLDKTNVADYTNVGLKNTDDDKSKESLHEEKASTGKNNSINSLQEGLSVQYETENSAVSSHTQINDVRIKSEEVSDEPFAGFEHLILENADADKIKLELNKQGIRETKEASADLTKNYIVKDYTSKQTEVKSDKNGNISMYFSVNIDNLFDVYFYDAQTNEEVGGFGVLANNENIYTFIGFEKGKSYNVEVCNKTENDWDIEGNYIIY